MIQLEYKENTASAAAIVAHFRSCDPIFFADLISRVDISQYAQKITDKGVRYETWQGNRLVGLLAAYHNEDGAEFDFITNISVVKDYTGHGIASRLMKSCIARSQAARVGELRLSVSPLNVDALALYNKFNFSLYLQDSESMQLSLKLT